MPDSFLFANFVRLVFLHFFMKIIATSDWHLGNLFHGNDRLPEHKHFMDWLLTQIDEQKPDALLIAGDIFDNGNPSANAQSAFYEFLADATQRCPEMQIVITAGNHDSANRLEAPRALLTRHKVEIRGNIRIEWEKGSDGERKRIVDYDDLIIPVRNREGEEIIVLAVPYLRSDIVQSQNYSKGVNEFIRELTQRARELHPDGILLMMAHMYATGADIAKNDASEKIIIGGQEEVSMDGWSNHPDYLTCGHIHKRQRIWNTDWARYSGSILPMSFAEKDYTHGVDLVTFEGRKASVRQLVYTPQHRLRILPEGDEELSPKDIEKLIETELPDRTDGKLDEHFEYLVLKVKLDSVSNDEISSIEEAVNRKNAVLCKIQKVIPQSDLHTTGSNTKLQSIDDILNRNPMDTLKEAFFIVNKTEMNDEQETMLQELLESIKNEESN